jgi:nucleoid DNA-binding protein
MTKTDLIEKLYLEGYCSKKDGETLVNAVFDVIRDALVAGDKVTISKFGTFEVRERSAKECKNPRTGEPVQVAASKAPAFKASKNLKEAVNA